MSYTFTLQEQVSIWVDRDVEIPEEEIEAIKQQVLEDGGDIKDFEDAVKDWLADNKWDYVGDSDYNWETEDSLDWQFEEESFYKFIEGIRDNYKESFQEGLVGEIE